MTNDGQGINQGQGSTNVGISGLTSSKSTLADTTNSVVSDPTKNPMQQQSANTQPSSQSSEGYTKSTVSLAGGVSGIEDPKPLTSDTQTGQVGSTKIFTPNIQEISGIKQVGGVTQPGQGLSPAQQTDIPHQAPEAVTSTLPSTSENSQVPQTNLNANSQTFVTQPVENAGSTLSSSLSVPKVPESSGNNQSGASNPGIPGSGDSSSTGSSGTPGGTSGPAGV